MSNSRNFKLKILTAFVIALGFIGISTASESTDQNATGPASTVPVKVALIDGRKFTDYELSGQSRQRSLKTIEKELNELFTKLSKEFLKDGESLEIDVTNMDLPGYIHYAVGSASQDIRIVRSLSHFRVYFNYRLKSADGKILNEGEHKLKEFLDLNSGIRQRTLRNRGNVSDYESPLREWFEETFTG